MRQGGREKTSCAEGLNSYVLKHDFMTGLLFVCLWSYISGIIGYSISCMFIHTYFSYYKSNSKLLLEKSQTIKIIFLSFHSSSSIPVLELTVFIQFQYFEIFCDICTTIHTYTHRLTHIPTCFLNVSMVIRSFSQFIHLVILTAI